MKYFLSNLTSYLNVIVKGPNFNMLFSWWAKYSIALSDPWGLEWVIRSELTLQKGCKNVANYGHSQY